MARQRRKKRTQPAPGTVKSAAPMGNGSSKTNPANRTPKSMVIRMGASDVGPSVTQLVKDMRTVMEPHTASKLQERRSNRLRDYTSMAGPLGVTHLLLFSRSSSGNTNLRLAVTPRGPTFNFRIDKYSLCKDVTKAQRRPKSVTGGVEHMTPPLLVMNNFVSSSSPTSTSQPSSGSSNSIPKHLESLTTSIFQSLFPPISPQSTPLSSIRRVLLLDRIVPSPASSSAATSSDGTYILNLRHYSISSKPVVSLSRGLKRLRAAERQNSSTSQRREFSRGNGSGAKSKPLPNLHNLEDVADFLTGDGASAGGYTSASDTEADTDAEVEVTAADTRKVLDKRERQRLRNQQLSEHGGREDGADGAQGPLRGEGGSTRRAGPEKRLVKLTELGPRLQLRLIKVEEGLCTGKVLWHSYMHKSSEEAAALEQRWDARRRERDTRRLEQRENIERKKRERGSATKAPHADAGAAGAAVNGASSEDDDEDAEWYDSDFDDYDSDAFHADDGEDGEADVDRDALGGEENGGVAVAEDEDEEQEQEDAEMQELEDES